jgi:hypothetical protein
MLEQFVAWLADTRGSIALHESQYMYTLIESTHVMSIMLFVGTIAMVDLRLLGVSFRETPVTHMLSKMLPWTITGFVVLIITGVLLFYAIPIRTFHSLWFRIKCTLLIIGGINIAIFTFKVERDKARWDLGPVPLKSKVASVISLSVWALVIVCGRLIAYNWADCDVATSPLVLHLSGCPNEEN